MIKKLLVVIVLSILLITMLSGCSVLMKDDIPRNEYINPISLEEVVKKIENKETFNFILGMEGCHACIIFDDALKDFYKEEQYKFNYMEYTQDTDMDLLMKLLKEYLKEDLDTFGTPTTYFIVKGEVADKILGAIEVDEIKTYSKYYK